MANLGFDVITMSTNHSYDKGKEGILNSLTFWESRETPPVVLGIHKSAKDQQENRVKIISFTVIRKYLTKLSLTLTDRFANGNRELVTFKSGLLSVFLALHCYAVESHF